MRKIKWLGLLYVFIFVIHLLCYSFMLVFQQNIIDYAEQKILNKLILFSILIILFMIIARITNLLSNLIKNRISMLYKNELRQRVSKKIIFEYDKNKNFTIPISWYTSDINQIEESYLNEILDFLFNLFGILISIYFLASYSWILFLATIFTSILCFLVSMLFQKKINKSTLEISGNNEIFYNRIKDIAKGFSLFWQNLILLRFIKINIDESSNIENKIKKNANQIAFQSESIYTVSTVSSMLILVFSGWLMYRGNITVGAVIAITQFSASFTSDSQALFRNIFGIVAGKKIANKFDKMEDISKFTNIDNSLLPSAFKTLEVKNLNFKVKDVQILNNINFTINKGEKILVIGKSGGGKTTMLSFLTMKNNTYDGNIFFNSENYKNLDSFFLFKWIYYSEQFPHIFDDTIKNNICLWNNEIKEQDIKNILQKLDFKNLNELSLNALNLSGGEKQKILMARALLSKREILIFDEPISSIDFTSGKKIIKYLLSLDKTIIIVSHKFDKDIFEQVNQIVNISNI